MRSFASHIDASPGGFQDQQRTTAVKLSGQSRLLFVHVSREVGMDAAAAGMSVEVQSELPGELHFDVASRGLEGAGSFGLLIELGGNISPGGAGIDGAIRFLYTHIAAAGAGFDGAIDFVEGDV